jgi:hypothetical protein
MSRSVELICVPPDTVRKVWPRVCDLICEAMRRGGLSGYQGVADLVLDGRALLWLAWDGQTVHAAAVTMLAATEWRKVCEIIACGGKGMRPPWGQGWLHLIEKIEDYARAEGCSAVRIVGRKGWQRMLTDYRARRVILEKEIA